MDQTLINRIVEAALLAASQPLTLAQLRELFPEDQPAPSGSIESALEQLRADCETRGVELVEVATGFRFQVKAEVHGWITRLWTERQTRYTRATLETLALIAYRQPITRGEIEQVRGVTVSSNIIKALEEREWIRVVGHRDVPGRPALFGTTKTFLDYFGLKRLDELPPLSELRDIGELEPQLAFDDAAGIAAKLAVGGLEGPTDTEVEGAAVAPTDAHDSTGASTDIDAREAGTATTSDGLPEDVPLAGRDGADASRDTIVDTHVATDAAAAGHDADARDGGLMAVAAPEDGGTGDHTADDETEYADEHGAGGDLDFRAERPVVFNDDENDIHDDAAGDVDPEAAPGERAADENDREQDNAVETTTVPDMTTASIDAAESNEDE